MEEKYDLVGVDGNAFSIMGYVSQAMKNEGFTNEEIKNYRNEATSSDYNNLLYVSLKYIDMCNEKENSERYENGD